MTLDQLKYFVAAATYQHVGRASVAVAISPSAISGAIATLEDELQCELFKRIGRRVELTSDGKRLLNRSQEILGEIADLKGEMRKEPEELIGKVRLGASHFLSSKFLTRGWMTLAKCHPKAVAEIYSMNTAHAIAEVLSGRLDLAVCISPLKHPDLAERLLYRGQMVVVIRKRHPILKASKARQVRFLSSTSAAIHKPSVGVETCESHPIFGRLGFEPKIALLYDSDETAVQCVLGSDSWSFVPDCVAHEFRDMLAVIDLPRSAGPAPYHVSALVHRERRGDRLLAELGGTLEEVGQSIVR